MGEMRGICFRAGVAGQSRTVLEGCRSIGGAGRESAEDSR